MIPNPMTHTKIFSVFAIVAVAAILIGAGFENPAFAKNEKTLQTNETVQLGPFPVGEICGVDPTEVTETLHIVIQEWSNGKRHVHVDQQIVWTDPDNGDAVVAEQSLTQNFNRNVGDLPITLQFNLVAKCADGTTIITEHCGVTIDENDEVHIHLEECTD